MEAASKQAAVGSSAGLDQLRQSAETMAAKLAEVEGRLASERSETSAQLDALRGQMHKEAVEEAKKAAAAVADDVKAAAAGAKPADVKGEVTEILSEKMSGLKKELDAQLQDQMKVREWRGA